MTNNKKSFVEGRQEGKKEGREGKGRETRSREETEGRKKGHWHNLTQGSVVHRLQIIGSKKYLGFRV